MRILIAAAGSHGDVAPYTGLGAELRRAGYDVVLATTDTFAPLVRDAGLEFRSLPADLRVRGGATGKRELMRTAAAFITELGQGFADAMDEGADLLLLSTTTAPLGWHLTEATGTPSLGVYLQPTAPTGDFPPVVTGSRSLGLPPTEQPDALLCGWPTACMNRRSQSCAIASSCPRPPLPRCVGDRNGRIGPSCTASARPWCPVPPTGALAWRSWATGGPITIRPNGCLLTWRTSCVPDPGPSSSASGAWRPATGNG